MGSQTSHLIVESPGTVPHNSGVYRGPLTVSRSHREVSDSLACEICDERISIYIVSRPVTSSCYHGTTRQICHPCLEKHIEAQMSTQSWDSITCWVPQCGAILQHKDMERFATPFDFQRYDEFLTRRAMGEDYTNVQCAHPGCRSGGYVDLKSISFFDCPACKGQTCVTCNTPYHVGEPCPDSEEVKRRAQEDEDATVAEIARISKPCPTSCGARIEKNEGCDHMTCRRCKHEFCWLCLKPYGPIRQRGNSAHASSCTYYRA